MEWLSTLSKNPLVQQVAGSFLVKPQPVPKTTVVHMAAPTAPASESGMSTKTMLMIGGGVLALLLTIVAVVASKK